MQTPFRWWGGGGGRPPSTDSANLQATCCSLRSADQHTAYFLNSEPPPQRGLPRPSLQLKQSHWPPPKAPAPHPAVFLPRDSALLDRTWYVTLCVHYMTSLLQFKLPGQMWNLFFHHRITSSKNSASRYSIDGWHCREPAHEIPPMTRSWGEDLTGKADQVFRDSEKLPPALTFKMISVFLKLAILDHSLISVTRVEGLPRSLSKQNQLRTLINMPPKDGGIL